MAAETTDVEEDEAPATQVPRSPVRRSSRRGGRPAAPSPAPSRRSPRRRTTGSKRKQEVAELPEEVCDTSLSLLLFSLLVCVCFRRFAVLVSFTKLSPYTKFAITLILNGPSLVFTPQSV